MSRVREKENMSQDELKKMQRMSYIKMVAMVGIVVAVIAFSSIAWFTMNREVEGEGVKMVASGDTYILSMVFDSDNDPDADGLYYDDYHSQVIDSEAVVWTMGNTVVNNQEQNFGNYTATENDGIYPRCHGCLSFNITPKVDGDVPLKFTFKLLGYNLDDEDKLVELDETNDADVINYLNGHILFFEDYDPDTGKYSGLLQMNNGVLNKTFNGNGADERVDIYWVWPLTLSTLVKPSNDTETVTLCSGNEYTAIENYVAANPQYFMKGITSTQANPLTTEIIKRDYPLYGGRYDQADNIIGARVRYLRLMMTVE